jgi:hypothetical protein
LTVAADARGEGDAAWLRDPRRGLLGGEQRAEDLGPDRSYHAVLGQADHRTVGQVGGGHDQVAERSDPVEEPGDLGWVADVDRIRAQPAGRCSGLCHVRLGELGAGRVEARPRSAGDHHRGSVVQAAPGHGQPDPGTAADDNDRVVCLH